MAVAQDLEFTYTQIDRLFRLSLGEMADFSGAKYDGDFSMSLEQAQRRKHEFIAENLGIGEGTRVIDLGCGWCPFLNYARSIGARGTGVTLSSGQAAACRRNGLDVHLHDARNVAPADFGTFDAAVSLGAFEHFCSKEEHVAGRQDEVYDGFFRSVRSLLPGGGRFFLQTMVFGPNALPPDQLDLNAPPGSDAYVMALMEAQFPGSWLPYGQEQLLRCAAPYFRMVSSSSGRLDYLETIRQWRRRFGQFSVAKLGVKLSLLPRYLTSRAFRQAFTSGISPNSICFERLLMDHYRIVFEPI